MPTYKVTDPATGRTLRLTGDSPPTDEELSEIFAGLPPKSGPAAPQAKPAPAPPNQVPEEPSAVYEGIGAFGSRIGQNIVSPVVGQIEDAIENPVTTLVTASALPLKGVETIWGRPTMRTPLGTVQGKTGLVPGMVGGMLRRGAKYSGQAIKAAESGDPLAAWTRANQAFLSAIPFVSESVEPADIDKSTPQAVGSGLADIFMLLADKPAAATGKLLNRGLGPLRSPEARYRSLFPETKAAETKLKTHPTAISDLVDEGVVAVTKKGLEKKLEARAAEKHKATQSAKAEVADVDVKLQPILDELKEAVKKNSVKGTAIDPAFSTAAKRMTKLVSSLQDDLAALLNVAGGKKRPSKIVRTEMAPADVQKVLEGTPQIEKKLDLVRMKGEGVGPKTGKFGELADLRETLDKKNSQLYKRANPPSGRIAAQKTTADAARKELATASPKYGKAAQKEGSALAAKELAGMKPDTLHKVIDAAKSIGRKTLLGSGGAFLGGPIGATALVALDTFVKSPAWKTVSAVTQNRVAQLLQSGRVGEALVLAREAVQPAESTEASTEE